MWSKSPIWAANLGPIWQTSKLAVLLRAWTDVTACDRICHNVHEFDALLSHFDEVDLFLPRLSRIKYVVQWHQRANVVFKLARSNVVVANKFLIAYYSTPLRYFLFSMSCSTTRVVDHVINEPSMPFSK